MAGRPGRGFGVRHERMPIDAAAQIMCRGAYWATDIIDISATGMSLQRPEDWNVEDGETVVVDLVVHDDLTINVEAEVRWSSKTEIGLHFTKIPENMEVVLWELLGAAADSLECY